MSAAELVEHSRLVDLARGHCLVGAVLEATEEHARAAVVMVRDLVVAGPQRGMNLPREKGAHRRRRRRSLDQTQAERVVPDLLAPLRTFTVAGERTIRNPW